jgi:hypothetical protein
VAVRKSTTQASISTFLHPLPYGDSSYWPILVIHYHWRSAHIIILSRHPHPYNACTFFYSNQHIEIPMQDSNRDAGPRLFQGAPHINATNGVFNQVGGDQYNNYNNAMNEMVVRRPFLQSNSLIVDFGDRPMVCISIFIDLLVSYCI